MKKETKLKKRIFELTIGLMSFINEEGLVEKRVLDDIYKLYNNVRVWQLIEKGYSLKEARWEVDQRAQGPAEF